VLVVPGGLHGIDPAIVALLGVLVTSLPGYGSVALRKALAKAPWSLLVFMAATPAMMAKNRIHPTMGRRLMVSVNLLNIVVRSS